ncbi:hypothetical protein QO002_001616 [Pararhizobium capsulatum DSM 1112]|uniref:Lipoprotein n=1 Tax=Pararhizobium capsulatum DSM 1112 TaxID=1121113 RepID=A0ABU0BNI6_9HYPH|nr:hypothetical protein [Pararhizobium capsulatum]MDQ0319478.1 hypothetical protein [Pararhizobium capsulatum DSM 1112]
MRARSIVFIAVSAALLAGCQTMTPEERRAADEKTCMSYGFRRGTDAMATCLQRIDLDRHAERRAFRYGYNGGAWDWDRPIVVYR